ncbi:MAG: transposase [Clostridia bacterium]|nr:transposase [Clostridia bacterium]
MSYKRILNDYGIYHVYNRGNDKKSIFARPEDKAVFLRQLSESQKENNFRLFAYSCMDNHFHLLYNDVKKQLPKIIGTLQENYAKYFNGNYKHTGQVFENPFKSKPVYNIKYFFTLVCYIENNAVDAKIVKNYTDYEWCSRISGASYLNMIDTEYLNYHFKNYKSYTLNQFIRENHTKNEICEFEKRYFSDDDASICFYNIVHAALKYTSTNLAHIDKKIKTEIVQKAYYAGLSIKQISGLSGFSIRFVRENKGIRDYI